MFPLDASPTSSEQHVRSDHISSAAPTGTFTTAPTATTQQTLENSNSSQVDGNPASIDISTPAPTATTEQTLVNSNSSQVDGNPTSTDISTNAPTATTQQTLENSNSSQVDGDPASTGISTPESTDYTAASTTPSIALNTSTLSNEIGSPNKTQANNSKLIEEDIGKAITDSIEEWKKRKAMRSEFTEVDYDPVSISIGVLAIVLMTAFPGLLLVMDGRDFYKQFRRAKTDIDSRFKNVPIKQKRSSKIHPLR